MLLGAGLGSLCAGALVQIADPSDALIVWGLGLGGFGGLMLLRGPTHLAGE